MFIVSLLAFIHLLTEQISSLTFSMSFTCVESLTIRQVSSANSLGLLDEHEERSLT